MSSSTGCRLHHHYHCCCLRLHRHHHNCDHLPVSDHGFPVSCIEGPQVGDHPGGKQDVAGDVHQTTFTQFTFTFNRINVRICVFSRSNVPNCNCICKSSNLSAWLPCLPIEHVRLQVHGSISPPCWYFYFLSFFRLSLLVIQTTDIHVTGSPVKLLAAKVDVVFEVFFLLCHRSKLVIQCLQLVGHLRQN